MTTLGCDTFLFALENTVDSVVITDMNSIIQYVNPAFTKITGYPAEEAIGSKPSIQRSPNTTDATYQDMWKVILSGGWWRGEIVNKKKNGEEWHSYLSISQVFDAAGAPVAYVGIARDITDMKMMEYQLREMSMEAIYMLSTAAEAKDEVTGSHIQRVRHYSEAIAQKLGLSKSRAFEIGYSSMMHDVGKIQIPDAILKKRDKLTRDEWEIMRAHPDKGVDILREKPFYETAREIAGNHHERWDGSGYPQGKKGGEIPLAARIVAVADVFDALTTTRPYKEAWTEEAALREIQAGKGTIFDPRVVEVFEVLCAEGKVHAIRSRFPED